MLKNCVRILIVAIMSWGLYDLSRGLWIGAKALLAQQLIARAWSTGTAVKPWPWADTWPVYRLSVPHLGLDLFVLEDSAGQGLAFGPMRLSSKGNPFGGLVIAGHRDTHFSFTRQLRPGHEILLEAADRDVLRYRVTSTRVVDSRFQSLAAASPELLLVTCYPFDAAESRGPLRYVVTALPQFIRNRSPAFHNASVPRPNFSL